MWYLHCHRIGMRLKYWGVVVDVQNRHAYGKPSGATLVLITSWAVLGHHDQRVA